MMKAVKWLPLFVALALALPAWGDSPKPNEIGIEKINYHGTGCRPGSVASSLAPDAKAFTLLFDDFIVDTSRGHGRAEDSESRDRPGPPRKGCNIDVDMRVPAGWAFALFSLDYRGFANLDANATASQTTHYHFAGAGTQIGKLELKGPKAEDYFHRTLTPIQGVEWSSCKGKTRKVHLKTDIHVKGRGLMTVDSADGELKHQFGIAWKRCAR